MRLSKRRVGIYVFLNHYQSCTLILLVQSVHFSFLSRQLVHGGVEPGLQSVNVALSSINIFQFVLQDEFHFSSQPL